MAEYHVKNGSAVAKAFKVRGGHQVVPAGKEADVADAKELTEAQLDAFERDGVKVKAKGAKVKKDDTGLKAVHRGGGSYSIMQGETEVVEKLSKEEAEAFNVASDEDKAAFVAARTK